MELLQFFLTSVIVYLGFIAGFIITSMAKEEKKAGKKYFEFSIKIALGILFLISIVYHFLFNRIIQVVIILYICLIIFIIYRRINETEKRFLYLSMFLSFIFFINSFNTNLFLISSLIIFIIFTLISSINLNKQFLIRNLIFIVFANITFLLELLLSNP